MLIITLYKYCFMKKLFFLVTLFLLSVISISAQSNASRSITGELFSEATEEPIPQANIRVLQKSDSTFVTGKASDLDGRFNIPVSSGSYILQISYIGYTDLFKDVEVPSSTQTVNLGRLTMNVDNILLSEAIVTAKAAEIVVKGDTLEYNADSYKVTESAVVEDFIKENARC